MMNSDKKPESELEEKFQNPLSFLDEIQKEITAENMELEALYRKAVDRLPVIDDFYSEFEEYSFGGMKRIEQAIDKSTGRKVALAWPKAESLSLKDKMIFLNEARISSILEHPNIIPVYHVGRNLQGMPAFVMKWLDGMSLEQYLSGQDERKNIQELLEALLKVCEAVAYAHDRGVIHLDLKPGNIQLGDFGEVLVLDWGLARLRKATHFSEDEIKVHKSIEDFLNKQLRGTLEYISPEQHLGAEPSKTMDIYALGKIVENILHHCSSDISESDYKTIDSIASKASAEQIEDRYESVNDLKKDIHDFLLGFAVEAESPGFIKLLRLFIFRHKPVFYTTTVAILILIVFTLIFINNLRKSEAGERSSRKIAEKALNSYKKENELRKDLLERLSVHSSLMQKEHQLTMNFEGAMEILEYLMALDSNNSSVWLQLGKLKLAQLDFEDSLRCFDKVTELGSYNVRRLKRFKEIAHKYKGRVDWQKSDYLEFLKDCIGIEYLEASFCSFIYANMDIDEQIDFFKEAIKLRNPEAVLQYELHESTLSIDLSSSKSLSNLSAAAGLSVTRLNLSNTRGADLRFFQNGNTKAIDISNSDIDNILHLPVLKELTARSLKSDELTAERHIWSNLRRIDLSGCKFKTWGFLKFLKRVEHLDLSLSNFDFNDFKLTPNLQALTLDSSQNIPPDVKKLMEKRGVLVTVVD